GLHGANRLASNSLLEAMVLGAAASRSVRTAELPVPAWSAVQVPGEALHARLEGDPAVIGAIRTLMWERVGLVRDARGLTAALAELERLERERPAETRTLPERNRLVVARLIAVAALRREESRGAHWRSDYPATNAALAERSFTAAAPALG